METKYRYTPPRKERHVLVMTAKSRDTREWIKEGAKGTSGKAHLAPAVKEHLAGYPEAKARSFCDVGFYYFEISFASKDDVDSFEMWFKMRYG